MSLLLGLIGVFTFPTAGFSLSHDWNERLEGTVTRCFSSEKVKAQCEDFSDPSRGREKVEELQISGTDSMERKFFYSYERGVEGNLCQEHLKKISKFLRHASEVCITGGLEWVAIGERETNAKWLALETRKGRVTR